MMSSRVVRHHFFFKELKWWRTIAMFIVVIGHLPWNLKRMMNCAHHPISQLPKKQKTMMMSKAIVHCHFFFTNKLEQWREVALLVIVTCTSLQTWKLCSSSSFTPIKKIVDEQCCSSSLPTLVSKLHYLYLHSLSSFVVAKTKGWRWIAHDYLSLLHAQTSKFEDYTHRLPSHLQKIIIMMNNVVHRHYLHLRSSSSFVIKKKKDDDKQCVVAHHR